MRHDKITIPECDLLIHAGDATFHGEPRELIPFAKWLNEQEAGNIIFVPGNHETFLEAHWDEGCKLLLEYCPALHILNDSEINIDGITIYGSPITPYFHNWAWNRARSERLVPWHGPFIKEHWDKIPNNIDILVTHGPPEGILDEVLYVSGESYDPPQFVGCNHLLDAVKRVKPQIHVFGHIHSGYGEKHVDGTSFYNASICDEMYFPSNSPHKLVYE